jgi:hypothetical protein
MSSILRNAALCTQSLERENKPRTCFSLELGDPEDEAEMRGVIFGGQSEVEGVFTKRV